MMMIVLTTGCFDLLTAAHVQLLQACRFHAEGGEVVVGLNTDTSIRRLKGPARPLIQYPQRKYVLQALRYVDRVLPLPDDTPCRLISRLKPDVYVLGGIYDQSAPELSTVEEHGGRVVFTPRFSSPSTTSIVNRIHRAGKP